MISGLRSKNASIHSLTPPLPPANLFQPSQDKADALHPQLRNQEKKMQTSQDLTWIESVCM